MSAIQKIIKHGNSNAVIIPKDIMQSTGLSTDMMVEVSGDGNRITIRPVDVVPRLSDKDKEFVERFHAEHKAVFDKLAE